MVPCGPLASKGALIISVLGPMAPTRHRWDSRARGDISGARAATGRDPDTLVCYTMLQYLRGSPIAGGVAGPGSRYGQEYGR